MKTIKQFLEALLELISLIITTPITIIIWLWRKIKEWWKKRRTWVKVLLISAIALFLVSDDLCNVKRFINSYNSHWEHYLTDETSVHTFHKGARLYSDISEKYLTPRYEWILFTAHHPDYDDSLTVFCKDNKRGFLNCYTGEIVIEPQYEAAWVFSDGLAAVKKDGKIGFINKKNEIVIPFKFGYYKRNYDFDQIDYAFHNGYCYMIDSSGLQGVIDKSGEWKIKPIYAYINKNWGRDDFYVIGEDGKVGYINSKMEVVLPTEYDDIIKESDGFILTKDHRKWKIDHDGNVIIPFMYDYIVKMEYIANYNSDADEVYVLSDEFMRYCINGYYGIYNVKTNEIVTPAIYISIDMFNKDLFNVQSANYSGYIIDGKGNIVVKEL